MSWKGSFHELDCDFEGDIYIYIYFFFLMLWDPMGGWVFFYDLRQLLLK